MKILSLSTCPLDPFLGSGKTRLRWSEGLRALGHSVEVAEPAVYETWHGLGRALRFRQAWGACGFVKGKLQANDYDLLEFFGGEFGLATRLLAKRQERPLLIAHTDGLEMLASERERAYCPPVAWRGRAYRWYMEQTHERLSGAAFAYADAFVTGCELDRQYVIERGIFAPERAAVVEPGLDREYLAMPFIAGKEHRVAYTGSWISRKGIDKLTLVMTNILRADEKLGLDIYSGGGSDTVLAGFPAALHSRIKVHNRLNNEELAAAMARAKVFFFPTQYEGFGMSLAEAMACSCAAVTTPTGFGAELRHGQEALLCDFNDVDAMQQAVEKLLADEEWRIGIAHNGWQRVQALSWQAKIKQLGSIYEGWLAEFQQGAWQTKGEYSYNS
jgi:glycosyltransferase involved in cell wall biosynthesis